MGMGPVGSRGGGGGAPRRVPRGSLTRLVTDQASRASCSGSSCHRASQAFCPCPVWSSSEATPTAERDPGSGFRSRRSDSSPCSRRPARSAARVHKVRKQRSSFSFSSSRGGASPTPTKLVDDVGDDQAELGASRVPQTPPSAIHRLLDSSGSSLITRAWPIVYALHDRVEKPTPDHASVVLRRTAVRPRADPSHAGM